MVDGSLAQISEILGISLATFVILMIWSLVWKAIALWKAARHKSLVWFILLLVINTFGILEILYIFVFSKMHHHPQKEVQGMKRKVKRRR